MDIDNSPDFDLSHIESVLEDVANKNNLSAINVKSIIKHLITDEQVVKFLKSCVSEEGILESNPHNCSPTGNNYEKGIKNKLLTFAQHLLDDFHPKMTRGKIRELRKKGALSSIWPVSPSHINSSNSNSKNVVKFGDLEFPSDTEDSDEDFVIKKDYKNIENSFNLSQDKTVTTTKEIVSLHSNVAIADSSTICFMDDDWSSASPDTDIEKDECTNNFKNSHHFIGEDEDYKEYYEWLQGIFDDDTLTDYNNVGHKNPTNRKTPRRSERSQTPNKEQTPAISSATYTCDKDPRETSTSYNEEEDPEYDLMAELENFIEDPEDLRNDRAVHVSRKELNELLNELFEQDSDDSCNREAVRLREKYQRLAQQKHREHSQNSEKHVEKGGENLGNNVKVSEGGSSNDALENADFCSYQMSMQERIQLGDQMRKHVQLLTQVYLLSCESQRLYPIKEVARVYLTELDKLASLNANKSESAFHPMNLPHAIEVIKSDQARVQRKYNPPPSKRKFKKDGPRKRSISVQNMLEMWRCRALLYPELLPVRGFRLDSIDPFTLGLVWWQPALLKKKQAPAFVLSDINTECSGDEGVKAKTCKKCSCGEMHMGKKRRTLTRPMFRSPIWPCEEKLLATGLSYWLAGSFITGAAAASQGLPNRYSLEAASQAVVPFEPDMVRALVRAITEPKSFAPTNSNAGRAIKSRPYRLIHDLLMPCKNYLTIGARTRLEANLLITSYPQFFAGAVEESNEAPELQRMISDNKASPVRTYLLTGRGPAVSKLITYVDSNSPIQCPRDMMVTEIFEDKLPAWLAMCPALEANMTATTISTTNVEIISEPRIKWDLLPQNLACHGVELSNCEIRENAPSSADISVALTTESECAVPKQSFQPSLHTIEPISGGGEETMEKLKYRANQLKLGRELVKKYLKCQRIQRQSLKSLQEAKLLARKSKCDAMVSKDFETTNVDLVEIEEPRAAYDQPRQLRTRQQSTIPEGCPLALPVPKSKVRRRKRPSHANILSYFDKQSNRATSSPTRKKSPFGNMFSKYQPSEISKAGGKEGKSRKVMKRHEIKAVNGLSLEPTSDCPQVYPNDLEELLKASSTVGFVPKGLSQIKLKKLNQKKKSYEETIDLIRHDLLLNDPLKQDKELAIAKCYLSQVKKALGDGSPAYKEFLSILISCPEIDASSACLIYERVSLILGHRPELLAAFSIFLPMETLINHKYLTQNMVMTNIRVFLRKLEVHLAKTPGFYRKTVRKLNNWRLSNGTTKELFALLAGCVKGNAYLKSEMQRLFPDSSPPKFNCHEDDFEFIDLTNKSQPGLKRTNKKCQTTTTAQLQADEDDNLAGTTSLEEDLDLEFEDLSHLLAAPVKHPSNFYGNSSLHVGGNKFSKTITSMQIDGLPSNHASTNFAKDPPNISLSNAKKSMNCHTSAGIETQITGNGVQSFRPSQKEDQSADNRNKRLKTNTKDSSVQVLNPFSITRLTDNAASNNIPRSSTVRTFTKIKIVHGKMEDQVDKSDVKTNFSSEPPNPISKGSSSQIVTPLPNGCEKIS